jgi:hypothetical protein
MTVNLRNDWQDRTLELLVEVTRNMIDAPIGIIRATEEQWKLVKELTEWVETTAKNQRGYLDNISSENKSKFELVKRRMKLLSTELDPQAAEVKLCEVVNPTYELSSCILMKYHSSDVDHMDEMGRRYR